MADEFGDIEVVVGDDNPRASGQEPAGSQPEATHAEPGGQRAGFQQRLDQFRARAGRAEREAEDLRRGNAALHARLEQLEQNVRVVGETVLTDAAARERSAKLRDVETKIAGITAQKRRALDEGDTGAVADLDIQLNEALIDRRALSAPVSQPRQDSARPSTQVQQPQRRAADPADQVRFSDFKERNGWYGSDQEASRTAWAEHERIQATQPGIVGTDRYYRMVEQAVAEKHPHLFDDGSGNGRAPALTGSGAQRRTTDVGNPGGPQRIVLSREQVEQARRLGIPQEKMGAYAGYALRAARSGGPSFLTEGRR